MSGDERLATRRSILVASLSAAAACGVWITGAIVPSSARAATGGNVVLGSTVSTNVATSSTQIKGPIGLDAYATTNSSSGAGVWGTSAGSAGYGVFSSGMLGTTGPLVMSTTTAITNFTVPSGKAALYVKYISASSSELHIKFPSGTDYKICAG